jgi:CMP-N,N'-diacetyllegionaminic acid synthase
LLRCNEVTGEVLALIPARGGSKGIPRKNILSVAGKPLIAWSIQQALQSTRITRVVVSTDDDEIGAVAREYGAEVPFIRPEEYADDMSPDIDVFRHALRFLADRDSYHPELVVHLRPTGPARRVSDIDVAIELLHRHPQVDSVRAVSVAHQSPYKMWELQEDGTMEPVLRLQGMTDCQSQPRQLLPPVYWQNGYVDVLRPRAVFDKNSMWGDSVLPFVVKTRLFDLDYPEDIGPMEEALNRLEHGLDAASESPERHPV